MDKNYKITLGAIGGVLALFVGIGVATDSGDQQQATDPKPETTTQQPPPATGNPDVDQGIGSKDASGDVELGEMVVTYDVINIPYTVINHSDESSNYMIEATVYDASGAQVDTAFTYIQNVAPGGKATGKLVGLNGLNADHYELSVVERTAA